MLCTGTPFPLIHSVLGFQHSILVYIIQTGLLIILYSHSISHAWPANRKLSPFTTNLVVEEPAMNPSTDPPPHPPTLSSSSRQSYLNGCTRGGGVKSGYTSLQNRPYLPLYPSIDGSKDEGGRDALQRATYCTASMSGTSTRVATSQRPLRKVQVAVYGLVSWGPAVTLWPAPWWKGHGGAGWSGRITPDPRCSLSETGRDSVAASVD